MQVDCLSLQLFCGLAGAREAHEHRASFLARKAESQGPLADWLALFVRFAFLALVFVLLALLELL